jgi:hypothetical protein
MDELRCEMFFLRVLGFSSASIFPSVLDTKLFNCMKPCQLTPLFIDNHTHFVDSLIHDNDESNLFFKHSSFARKFYALFQKYMLL